MTFTASPPPPSRWLTPARAALFSGVLLVLLVALLLLAPAEQQLGNLLKVIYLHGALARMGIYAMLLAGLLGALYLLRPLPALLRWSNATQVAGMTAFIVHFLLSVIPTHATWGMWIAFDEPRTRMSLQIIGVGLLVMLVRHLLNDHRFSALSNLLLAGAVLLLNLRTGVLRHPLNPIGDSSSSTIQIFYLAILLVCGLLTALLAWALATRTDASTA
ncbi:MAG: hypothetical protein WAZ19_13310 [Anaerolineae bacterium]